MSEARCRVDFAQSARDDLRDILDWYVSQDAPQVGRRLVLEIVDRVRQLATFPDSGKAVPEFEVPSLREIEHPPFRVVYRRDATVVTVVRVLRSERSGETLARLSSSLLARDVGGAAPQDQLT